MNDPVASLLRQAAALSQQGRRREAIEAYRRLLAAHPGETDSWYDLGYLLKAEGRYEEALKAYGEALTRGVQGPEEVRLNRAVIFADHLLQDEAAEAELKAALEVKPDYAPALLNLGNLYEERGAREEAVACYERLVALAPAGGDRKELEPYSGEALARLAHLRPPATPDDPLLSELATAAASPRLDNLTRANLYFALGRALDAIREYDRAFPAFEEANRCARRTGPVYDRGRMEREVDALIAACPAGRGHAPALASGESDDVSAKTGLSPVFICGMFRSGSTLIEQVLSAHHRVTPGGELHLLPRLAAGALAPFPAAMAKLPDEKASALAREYRAQLVKLFPDAERQAGYVTDKRPDNFRLIGLIKRLFPDAKIVHTVRNPLDNCLSVYFQHLDQRLAGYSSDLGDIAHYYAQYRRLMAHFKSVFADDIHDVDYDALVRDPRPELEKLLDFLELDWDDACLAFHRLKNTVKTASYWQVRRPLYGDASGRWRNYEARLGPVLEALQAEGLLGAGEGPFTERPAP